jgi:hypothetical protein
MHKIRNFHEGHSTVREWQGSGMVCVNRPLAASDNCLKKVATYFKGFPKQYLSGFQMSHLTIITNKEDLVLGIGCNTVRLVPDMLRQCCDITFKVGPQC